MTTTFRRSRLVLVAAAMTTLGLVAAGAVSAATDTTEPADTASMVTEAEGTAAAPAAGSTEPSADVAAFCDAVLGAAAASASEDPEVITPAFEALTAVAPEEVRATVEEVVANLDAGAEDLAFADPYRSMLDYVAANCGFAEVNVAASEYAFGGIPEELAAGPTIINLENIGEQVHEIAVYRINDDVTMPIEEVMALPEEESASMVTFLGENFAFPGDTGHVVVDLTQGRHVALCFIPDGTTADSFDEFVAAEEAAEEMEAEGTVPEGSAPAEGSATTTAGSAPAAGSIPAQESTPAEGSAHAEEGAPRHWTLGMLQEFTVV